MSRIAYVNGAYLPHREASVHIEDRGYQFADGVYEVILIASGRMIDTGLHLARLARSLAEIRIPPPLSPRPLRLVLAEVARRNRVEEGLLYLQVTRGVARREHPFPKLPVRPALIVTARRGPGLPRDIEGWAARAITAPDERWARCDIKTIGLLPNVLAKQAAVSQGAAEAILLGRDGMVTEGASTSVWIVDAEGTLRTRRLGPEILPGCTRAALLELLRAAGLRFAERAFSAAELAAAREVFLTSATSYVRPILAVDGAPVADGKVGPIARRLFSLFAAHVRGGAAG
ncbi:MAG: D-amino-acid transaminase [Acetobacteraceae bacterium]